MVDRQFPNPARRVSHETVLPPPHIGDALDEGSQGEDPEIAGITSNTPSNARPLASAFRPIATGRVSRGSTTPGSSHAPSRGEVSRGSATPIPPSGGSATARPPSRIGGTPRPSSAQGGRGRTITPSARASARDARDGTTSPATAAFIQSLLDTAKLEKKEGSTDEDVMKAMRVVGIALIDWDQKKKIRDCNTPENERRVLELSQNARLHDKDIDVDAATKSFQSFGLEAVETKHNAKIADEATPSNERRILEMIHKAGLLKDEFNVATAEKN